MQASIGFPGAVDSGTAGEGGGQRGSAGSRPRGSDGRALLPLPPAARAARLRVEASHAAGGQIGDGDEDALGPVDHHGQQAQDAQVQQLGEQPQGPEEPREGGEADADVEVAAPGGREGRHVREVGAGAPVAVEGDRLRGFLRPGDLPHGSEEEDEVEDQDDAQRGGKGHADEERRGEVAGVAPVAQLPALGQKYGRGGRGSHRHQRNDLTVHGVGHNARRAALHVRRGHPGGPLGGEDPVHVEGADVHPEDGRQPEVVDQHPDGHAAAPQLRPADSELQQGLGEKQVGAQSHGVLPGDRAQAPERGVGQQRQQQAPEGQTHAGQGQVVLQQSQEGHPAVVESRVVSVLQQLTKLLHQQVSADFEVAGFVRVDCRCWNERCCVEQSQVQRAFV